MSICMYILTFWTKNETRCVLASKVTSVVSLLHTCKMIKVLLCKYLNIKIGMYSLIKRLYSCNFI